MDTSSPHGPCGSGLEAMLWFQQQLSQVSKDQIWAKKEAVCQASTGGWQLSVGEWRTRLQEGQGTEKEAATRGHHGRKRRFQKYKQEKMERNEILES